MATAMLRDDDGYSFRDLNKNGRLDPYEDARRPVEERVENLLLQMTLEEKAGAIFHTMTGVGGGGADDSSVNGGPSVTEMIETRLMNHFNVFGGAAPRVMAEWSNFLQALAEGTRLGIPITLSTDPRHSFSNNPATNFKAEGYSTWPESLGLAATDDLELVQSFADCARQEYLAVGIRVALHPMIDLATEPRWARANGTFGEDAALASRMVAAYIRGFQGESLGPHSVACMTKHFPGGGPQMDGEDAHFAYGREQVYPGDNFEYHLIPFEAAFEAGTAQIMPYYGMPVGLPLEEVGFGFHKEVITGMLRGRFGFDSVVCTDWGLLTDKEIGGTVMVARAWGVEHLSVEERTAKAIEAGVDQFGGEACPDVVVALVQAGVVSAARLDESLRRLLRDKFRLGLFDDPYLDLDASERIVGSEAFLLAGVEAQRRSIVLLKNGDAPGGKALPLGTELSIYVENVSAEAAAAYGRVVSSIEDADVAILRLATPYEPRVTDFLESFFHAGDLSFPEEELSRILGILARVPTVVDIYLERAAVNPEIAAQSAAFLASFGSSDEALLDVIFGRHSPSGKLPFELPSSMEAVREQKEDLPYDSESPLFPFGHGLAY